jgi:hypothetical protein
MQSKSAPDDRQTDRLFMPGGSVPSGLERTRPPPLAHAYRSHLYLSAIPLFADPLFATGQPVAVTWPSSTTGAAVSCSWRSAGIALGTNSSIASSVNLSVSASRPVRATASSTLASNNQLKTFNIFQSMTIRQCHWSLASRRLPCYSQVISCCSRSNKCYKWLPTWNETALPGPIIGICFVCR